MSRFGYQTLAIVSPISHPNNSGISLAVKFDLRNPHKINRSCIPFTSFAQKAFQHPITKNVDRDPITISLNVRRPKKRFHIFVYLRSLYQSLFTYTIDRVSVRVPRTSLGSHIHSTRPYTIRDHPLTPANLHQKGVSVDKKETSFAPLCTGK